MGTLDSDRLAFAYVTASVAHFVSFEVGNLTDRLARFGSVAGVWSWAVVAMFRMGMIVDVPVEVCRAMKPGASSNEDTTRKPFWSVIAVRRAIIGRGVIVTVGTVRGNSNGDSHLSLCCGGRYREADRGDSNNSENLKIFHRNISSSG